MKKNSIITLILILLILLTAVLFFKGCGQQTNEMKLYDVSGNYTEKATYKNGKITVSDVSIENASFTGNVLVDSSLNDGNLHLTDSNVVGDLLIKGGGDAIYIDGGSYQSISVEKENVKIIFLGNATTDSISINANSTLIVGGASTVTTIIINQNGSGSKISTEDNGIINTINANSQVDLILNTPGKNISFGSNATASTLLATQTIDKIQTEAEVSLTLNDNLGLLIITKNGKNTSVTLNNDAVIASIGTDAKTLINGQGSVTAATTNNKDNLTGTIVPDTIYISLTPIVSNPSGGYMITPLTTTVANKHETSFESWSKNNPWYHSQTNTITPSVLPIPVPIPVPTPIPTPIPTPVPTPVPTPTPIPSKILVSEISITPQTADLIMGNTLTLKTTILPNNATDQSVTWKSSDSRIATVTNGIITPIANGTVTITVETVDGKKTATSTITIKTNITDITMIDSITTSNQTVSETIDFDGDYILPIVVVVKGYSNETFPCSVNWEPVTADTTKVGETIYSGTLTLPEDYINTDDIKPLIKLTVHPRPLITIDSKLTSQRIYLCGTPAPLTIKASVSQEKTLQYAWFKRIYNNDHTYVDTDINNVTRATYTPPLSEDPGSIYYYCKLSTDNAIPITTLVGNIVTGSDLANPITLAELPDVNLQPVSLSDITPGSKITLSVDASVTDGGSLAYQWYQQSDPFNADGTLIPLATTASVNLDASDDPGVTYYYVEITNTEIDTSSVISVSLPVSVTVI
jgi:hypothetical protein